MASSGKKKTTMAKLAREARTRERRLNKQAKKDDLLLVDRAHLPEQPFARRGELRAQAAAVSGARHARQAAGLLQPVDELRDATAAERELGGELAHARMPLLAALHRPQQLEPAQRRQVGGGQRPLHAIGHGRVGGDDRTPAVERALGHMTNSSRVNS